MYHRIISYQIHQAEQNLTIQEYLRHIGYSQRVIIRLKEQSQGLVLNGQSAYANVRLKEGDCLEIHVWEEDGPAPSPCRLPLNVLYEDQDLLAVSKPAGMPVHPSIGHHQDTLAQCASWYFFQKGQPFTFRAISRLDRDTSGVLLLARNMVSACLLSNEMKARRIHRTYLALVCGKTPPEGRVEAPIGRDPDSILKRRIDWEKGQAACTWYRRLCYIPDNDLSFLMLKLETGRTHQIRVHMASIGHPLPGDFLYHPDDRLIQRQPLHSAWIQWVHPITGQSMEAEAPLPEDMKRLLPPGFSYQFQRSPLG